MSTFIVGVDPGGTTGVSMWNDAQPTKVVVRQLHATAVRDFLTGLVDAGTEESVFIFAVERFVIARNTVRKKGATKDAPGIIQSIRNIAADHGCEVRMRGAAESKTFTPNERLRKLNWYSAGQQHANDATRQVVLCLAECFPETFATLMGV